MTNARAQAPHKKLRRVSVADAKTRLSSLIREAAQRPTVIQNRGRDVAVLVSLVDYERVNALVSAPAESRAERFLREVEELKVERGGGVDDFSPSPIELRAEAVHF